MATARAVRRSAGLRTGTGSLKSGIRACVIVRAPVRARGVGAEVKGGGSRLGADPADQVRDVQGDQRDPLKCVPFRGLLAHVAPRWVSQGPDHLVLRLIEEGE